MAGQDIHIETQDGQFSGYLSLPASGTGPGILVLQEIFGVNAVMRGVCDWLASEGFVALCPDLFWRIEPNIQITAQTEAEWARAFELYQAFNIETGMIDIKAALSALRARSETGSKAGAIGYCLGGFLAYMTACHTDSDATVGYYGVGIDNRIDDAAALDRPLILHLAGKDEFVPAAAQAKIHAAFDGHDAITLHDYPENDHAFTRAGGAHFDQASANLANGRTLDFLRKHLG